MRHLLALIAFALVVAACGDSGATGTTMETLDSSSSDTLASAAPQAPAEQQGPQQPLPESDYPDVVVTDLAGGQANLRELALEQNPVLLWFWAPH